MKAISDIVVWRVQIIDLTWGICTVKVSELISFLQDFDIGKYCNIYVLTWSKPYAFYFDI